MKIPSHLRTLLVAVSAAAVTLIITTVTRPAPRTRFVKADQSLRPSAPLDRRVRDLVIDRRSLSDALALLADNAHVDIHLWPSANEAAHTGGAEPLSLRIHDLSLAKVLSQILESAGGPARLGFWEADGMIEVATEQEAVQSTIITRIYDVRDIIRDLVLRKDLPEGEEFDRTSTTPVSTHEEAERYLSGLIKDAISSETWKDNGGSFGSLRIAGGLIVVTQTAETQDSISLLLDEISSNGMFKPLPSGSRIALGRRMLQFPH